MELYYKLKHRLSSDLIFKEDINVICDEDVLDYSFNLLLKYNFIKEFSGHVYKLEDNPKLADRLVYF